MDEDTTRYEKRQEWLKDLGRLESDVMFDEEREIYYVYNSEDKKVELPVEITPRII